MASSNRVEVHIGANTSDLKLGMKESESVVNKTAKEIENTGRATTFKVDLSGMERSFEQTSKNIQSSMQHLSTNISNSLNQSFASVSNSFKSMTSLFAGAVTIKGITDMADGYVQMAAQIRNASTSTAEYNKVQEHLLETANTTYRSLEEAQQVYLDVGGALKAFGTTTEDALRITDSLSFSFTHNATASDKAASATSAFMKSIYSGKVTGDAFVTMLSAIPSVVDDLSVSMDLPKDKILEMGNAGMITGDQLKKAFNQSREANEDLANAMENSVKDGLTVLRTELSVFVGKANEAYAITGKVSAVLVALGKNIDTVAAGLGAVAAVMATRYIVQMALSIKTTIAATIENVRNQASLSALSVQATATTRSMVVLRGAMAMLGGPAGLGMLAVQGLAAGAAFLFLKKSSDQTEPALDSQGKTVAKLREEYDRLDQAQQRVLTRQAKADLSTAEKGFRKQELALLGLVRAVINHSDASATDRQKAKELYDQYLQGKIKADQLATGINNLTTVEEKHKKRIDEKSKSLTKEKEAVSKAESVLKSYSSTTRQATTDNKAHTKSINDKADAYANLTDKQREYVDGVNKDASQDKYVAGLRAQGFSQNKAEFYAQAKQQSGTNYTAPMPDALKTSVEADWKREQAAKARADAEKKAEESQKRQTSEAEKQYKFKDSELKMLKRVAELSAKHDLDGIGAKHGIPKNYLAGLMAQESKGDPNAVSPTGAIGYFQTTSGYRKDNNISIGDSKNLPVIANVVAKNLASAYEKLGSWEAAIRSHNAGVAGSAQFERTGRVTGSDARNKEVANFAPAVNKWIVGLGGSNLKSGGIAKSNSAQSVLDYQKFEDEKIKRAEEAEKDKIRLQYDYADEQKKVALDLSKALDEINKSTLGNDEKKAFSIQAEKEAADKIKAIRIEQLEKTKELIIEEIQGKELLIQRIYDLEAAQIKASFDAKKISNAQRLSLDKQLEDRLTGLKRHGLLERLAIEQELSGLTGQSGSVNNVNEDIATLDNQKAISDINMPGLINEAQMQDFESKFGGLTDRISNLWDKGIQSMMDGTLTWQNATNAVLTDMGAYFIQSMVTQPLKAYLTGLAKRMAVKLGFIKTETAAEVTGQAAQTTAVVAGETTKTAATGMGVLARLGLKAGEAIKSIMMYAWEAMAGAFKAMVSIPYVGPVLAVAAGASALALVGGLAGKIKSARGGYDIPSGVNPVTQLHEEEMVLPKQHANTIRALGKSMRGGGDVDQAAMAGSAGRATAINIQAWDSRDLKRFMKKHGRELAGGLKGYNRNFGK